MNIMQVVPRLEVGGVERGTVDLARYLTLNAHKAVVVSGGGKLVKKLDEVGARHYTLPIGRKNPFIMVFMVFKLCEIIKRENIDVVHARSRVPALVAFLASRLTLKAFITTAHGQYKKHLMSYVMGWGKRVIVANAIMSRYIIENFAVRPDKIKVIPRGVDTRKFAFQKPNTKKHKDFTVGMISRMTPIKGHLDFIKAVSALSRSVSKLKVYIVGKRETDKTDYVRQIELLIKRLALNNIVEFLDETEDVPGLLKRLDVLVSANREQEAFGRIIIEAQSVGVPSVATKVGGVVDIIEDGVTGLLCEPSNPRDMTAKIMQLYKDIKLRNSLAENARKSVEGKYNLNKMMKSTLEVYEDAIRQTRILIIKISSLGDIILSFPSLRAIREKYPKAVIKVLVDLKFKDALKNNPYIDDIVVCDFKSRDKGIKRLLRIGGILKNEDFDMVIDFQNNKKSHILSFLSCAALRYGYDNGKLSFFLNRKVKDTGLPMDPIEHQMKVLGLMGIYNVKKELDINTSEEDKTWAEKFLKDNWIKPSGPFACLHLESSPRWLTKRWPVEYYATIAGKIAQQLSMRVVVTGQDVNDEGNRTFFKLAKGKPISAVAKTTLGRLIALIEKASVLITSDSAPMHIASGVDTPFVALFGPTDPKRHTPPAKKCKVIKKDEKCSPCYKPTCDRGYVCMKGIAPDEVFEAVRKMVKPGKKK